MALPNGIKAPEFSLQNQEGKQVNFPKDLIGKPSVLIFYPKDFTAGCTAELCSFRDSYDWFREMGIEIIAISHDSVGSHQQFGSKHQFDFQLLSDPGRRVARLYDAVFPFSILTKRISYFVDNEGSIRFHFDSMLNAERHLFEIQNFIKKHKPTGLALK